MGAKTYFRYRYIRYDRERNLFASIVFAWSGYDIYSEVFPILLLGSSYVHQTWGRSQAGPGVAWFISVGRGLDSRSQLRYMKYDRTTHFRSEELFDIAVARWGWK